MDLHRWTSLVMRSRLSVADTMINKKRKLEQHDQVIAAIECLREGALDKDLGLGRSIES